MILCRQTYPARVDMVDPPAGIRKGGAALFTIKAYVTDPAADFEFGAFQPLGHHVSPVPYFHLQNTYLFLVFTPNILVPLWEIVVIVPFFRLFFY